MSAQRLVRRYFIVSICWSFVEGEVPAESRWSAQPNILTVSTEGHWDVSANSFHRSQLRFSISVSPVGLSNQPPPPVTFACLEADLAPGRP